MSETLADPFDEPTAEADAEQKPAARPSRSRSRSRSRAAAPVVAVAASDPRTVRKHVGRVVDKTLQLVGADPAQRAELANRLGVDADDTAALVYEVLENGAKLFVPVTDIEQLAAMDDPMAALIKAATIGEDARRFRNAWQLLGDRVPERVPAGPLDAARVLATTAMALSPDDLAGLRAGLELVG